MSDRPIDPTGGQPGAQDQPSEEEVRAYLSQLREAPVEQVLAEVSSALLNAAQVKLGRRDARLLIDLTAAIADGGRDALSEDIIGQLDDALNQLRVAQVEAEKQVSASGEAESNDLGQEPSDAEKGPSEGSSSSGPADAGGDAASRLWVPGR